MHDHRDAPSPNVPVAEARYQRFVRALALGALAVGATTGCGSSTTTDAGFLRIDASMAADASADTGGAVDGPLPPPDLPRRV